MKTTLSLLTKLATLCLLANSAFAQTVITNAVTKPWSAYPLNATVATNDDLLGMHWSGTNWSLQRTKVRSINDATRADGTYCIALIPDAQYYATNATSYYTNVCGWLVTNASALNLKAVLGLGDIVDDPSVNAEWVVASNALKLIDSAGIPNLNPPGNHDYEQIASRSLTNFNTNFPLSRYSGKAWYGGSYDSTSANIYIKLDIGITKLLIFGLEFGPRTNVLNWAAGIMQSNLDRSVIVDTHAYMYDDNTRIGPGYDWNPKLYYTDATDGADMWSGWFTNWQTLRCVVSGHEFHGGNGSWGRLTSAGSAGQPVMQMLSDYQATNSGNGFIRLLFFRPDGRVDVKTYSTVFGTYLTDSDNQFSFSTAAFPSTLSAQSSSNLLAISARGETSDSGATVAQLKAWQPLRGGLDEGLVFDASILGTNVIDTVSYRTGTQTLTTVTNGQIGNELLLTNGYVSFPYLGNMSEITVALWMKSTNPANEIFVSEHSSGTSGNFYFGSIYDTMSHLHLMTVNNSAVRADLVVTNVFLDNLWHHVAATWQTNTGAMHIYVDGQMGVEVNPTNQTGTLNTYSSAPLLFGAYYNTGSPNYKYTGSMRQMKIWNRALSASEIARLYNAQSTNYAGNVSASVALTAGTLTAGTLTVTSNSILAGVNASGAVQFSGVASITNVNNVIAAKTVTTTNISAQNMFAGSVVLTTNAYTNYVPFLSNPATSTNYAVIATWDKTNSRTLTIGRFVGYAKIVVNTGTETNLTLNYVVMHSMRNDTNYMVEP